MQDLSDGEDFAESFESALRGLVDCIDEMLGENAAKKIFGDSEKWVVLDTSACPEGLTTILFPISFLNFIS